MKMYTYASLDMNADFTLRSTRLHYDNVYLIQLYQKEPVKNNMRNVTHNQIQT